MRRLSSDVVRFGVNRGALIGAQTHVACLNRIAENEI